MVDIKISGRKVSVSDGMRDHVLDKVGESLKAVSYTHLTLPTNREV